MGTKFKRIVEHQQVLRGRDKCGVYHEHIIPPWRRAPRTLADARNFACGFEALKSASVQSTRRITETKITTRKLS